MVTAITIIITVSVSYRHINFTADKSMQFLAFIFTVEQANLKANTKVPKNSLKI